MIIRWVCEKDNKKWMYPVDKCIYCKGDIKKVVSKKSKIIGLTKVNIPSPSHPIIPYYVILLEDEYGNRMPKKTMNEYKIGDNYEIKRAKSDSAVVITKIKYDIFEYLKESIELLHNYDVKDTDKILIKPTVIQPAYPHQAVNTNPKLLDAVIAYLKEKGVTDIVVAEQSIPGEDLVASAKKSNILEICKKYNLKILDLSKDKFAAVESNGYKFKIAKEIMERKIINLPAMKTNSQICVSGAMENMLRIASQETQKMVYDKDVDNMLPLLIKTLPEFLTIGDATIGMQGQGPTSLGEPAFMNKMLLSKDPVAVDAVFAEAGMMKLPRYVEEAEKLGIGKANIKKIEVVGDEIDAIKIHLKQPERDATSHPKIKLIDGKADSFTFNSVLKLSGKLTELLGYELSIAIGKYITEDSLKGKERIVAYGDDAINRLNELGIKAAAEISENMDDVEKLMMVKHILEDSEKKDIYHKR